MMPVLTAVAGFLFALMGTTVAVSAAAVSRLEMTRWISHRLRGAVVASTLFAAPGSVLRAATAVGALGALTLGVASAVVFVWRPLVALPLMILLVPTLGAVLYGTSRALGRAWPEAIVRRATPWARRLGFLRLLLPFAKKADHPTLADVMLASTPDEPSQEDEIRLISGVLAFTERSVRDVMTPRTDIVALSEGASLEEVGRIFTESGYSRLPVYRDSLDNIIGMIYAFDLLKVTPGGELPLRPVVVSPGSKECATLLLELQREGRQMAIVLDEYGGTAGIATVEDLLEELVGEIFDDDDTVPEAPDSTVDLMEVTGSTSAQDVSARFGVELPNGVETIGGFIAREAGRIPHPGERLIFNGLEFDILAGSSTHIERVVVRRGPVRPITIDR